MVLSDDLTFAPEESLTIRVSEAHPAQTVLRISNPTAKHVAFKVKTTTPERYLVKPNHGLIRNECTTEITIIIVHAKKREILNKVTLNGPTNCNDKFLVQSATIDGITMEDLESKTSHELADAITRLFCKKDKKELHAKKIPVDLLFLDLPGDDGLSSERGRHMLQVPLEATATVPIPGTPEAMFAEIVALRKKYDDLVAFTVNLTAERDCLATELAAKNNSIQRQSGFTNKAAQLENKPPPYRLPSSFSLIFVIMLSFVSCLLGWSIPQITTLIQES